MSIRLTLDRTSPVALYRQVERQIRAAVDAGLLRPGERVPSVRALAGELEVGRLTIATAYEQLAADGYLVGRVGFGTVVAPSPPSPPSPSWSSSSGQALGGLHGAETGRRPPPTAPVKRPPIERPPAEVPGSLPSEGAAASRFDLRPGPLGGPGVSAGPALERLFREAWRDLGDATGTAGVADSGGDPLLRATIATHLRISRGARCEPSQVVVLSGALIGVAAVARLWLSNGSVAAVEDPGDPALRRALALGGARVVPVPIDRHGLRPDLLPDGAAVALVGPTVQALTGARMPLARRLRLLAWAAASGAIVVEDALSDELALGAPAGPALQGLDEDGRVVHLGAFASILHPGVRLGYAVVPPDLVEPFAAAVAGIDPGATPVQQRALGRFLADGQLDRHLTRVRRALAERLDAATEALRRELGWLVSVEPPMGGSRIVVSIEDEAWTASAVAAVARDAGVALEPLSSFRFRRAEDRDLVIDVGRHEPAEIRQAIHAVAAGLRRAGTRTAAGAVAAGSVPAGSVAVAAGSVVARSVDRGAPSGVDPAREVPGGRRSTAARRWPIGGRPPAPRLTPLFGRGEPA